MTDLADLIVDLAKLHRIGTTQLRDISPEDQLWFTKHPLREALVSRGIITSAVVAAAVIEWLEPMLEEPGVDYRINPPTDPAAPENRPAAT